MNKKFAEKVLENDRGVLDYLISMRDLSSLMVDLAYSSLLTDDKALAEDVESLYESVRRLEREVNLKTILSRVPPADAEGMVAVLEVAKNTEDIANSARHIAAMVRKGVKKHSLLREVVSQGRAAIVKVEVKPESASVGKPFQALDVVSATGMHLIAIKKKEWKYLLSADEVVNAGDVLLFKGPQENKKKLEKLFG
ncbi:MAG: hypothetical protein JW834_04795 [Candidatus Diapherotrites archaeon]|nr:hypothetical protein [Candidatus Diapherotrites archaeon]